MCAGYLASADVDVISYACTSGSFEGGPGSDKVVLQRIAAASSGTAAVAAATAVVESLGQLHIRRLSVVTPYIDEVNAELAKFLAAAGFDVVQVVGRGLLLNKDIAGETPEQILEFATRVVDRHADGVFLSCTNWRALDVVDQIESELRLPVVTSNQALIWKTLRALGLESNASRGGMLLRSAAATPPLRSGG
jgi:maleate isomerase